MGVTGGSGGGLLTNWVVTQTDALQSRGQPARHLRLGQLLVHRRLHAVHADLVPQGAVRGSRGLREAIADHLRREHPDAADVHPRRRGLADAARRRRRGHVPGVEVPEAPDRDGPLPRREPRALALRQALAPRRTPPAHRRLVRQVADGEGRGDVQIPRAGDSLRHACAMRCPLSAGLKSEAKCCRVRLGGLAVRLRSRTLRRSRADSVQRTATRIS